MILEFLNYHSSHYYYHALKTYTRTPRAPYFQGGWDFRFKNSRAGLGLEDIFRGGARRAQDQKHITPRIQMVALQFYCLTIHLYFIVVSRAESRMLYYIYISRKWT
jgi:hypothetical protein